LLACNLPTRTLANKGYAFVNMTSPDAARRLWKHLHGHRWEVRRRRKTCAVDYGAVQVRRRTRSDAAAALRADGCVARPGILQGLDRLLDHFSGSAFECDSEELLPVRFEPPRDGTRPALGAAHVVGVLRRRS